MAGEVCRLVFNEAENKAKAESLDAHSPQCACESHTLGSEKAEPVVDDEIIIRVLVSPDHIDLDTDELMSNRLTAVHSSGLSVLRQCASDDEIRLTVHQLTQETAEPNTLYGAAIMRASEIRSLNEDNLKWFCVYDTYADQKPSHADVFGTTPLGSKSSIRKQKSDRRGVLAQVIIDNLIRAEEVDDLISRIRAYPINIT